MEEIRVKAEALGTWLTSTFRLHITAQVGYQYHYASRFPSVTNRYFTGAGRVLNLLVGRKRLLAGNFARTEAHYSGIKKP